jgi:ssDNA-binding Zn-finger/Zn-ribbon topoisomerase 1
MDTIFDKAVYFTDEHLVKKNELKYLFDHKGEKCKICGVGTLIIPERKDGEVAMPYGAYLTCDSCKAILSRNLNLKAKSNEKCPQCGTELKELYNYETGETKFICTNYKECNWSGKLDDVHDALDKESRFIMSDFDFLDSLLQEEIVEEDKELSIAEA